MERHRLKLLLILGPLVLIVLLHGYAHGPVSGAPGIDFGIVLIMLAPYAVFTTVAWLIYAAYRRQAAGTAHPPVSGGSGTGASWEAPEPSTNGRKTARNGRRP
ncbi:MAG: hypothetical protein HY660_14650 [Armatimonadetes bacterium]|nr:hypothetical protein [Armatimonadota bacterium]